MQKRNERLVTNLSDAFMRRGDSIIPDISQSSIAGAVPTDAELDSAFGAPSQLPDPIFALLDAGGAGTDVFLIVGTNSAWFHLRMDKAT